MKTFGKWIRAMAVLALGCTLLVGGCAVAQQKPDTGTGEPMPTDTSKSAYRPSKDAVAVIEITDAGSLRFFNSGTGEPLPSCQLCTPELEKKYGPACTRAKGLSTPLCQGSVGATVFNLEQVSVVRSRVNPYCPVIYFLGKAIQVGCTCSQSEPVPPGTVCTKWIP
ncbi:MAG: hypothetical protein ABI794_04940 [Betaproteobacteria bacterium]